MSLVRAQFTLSDKSGLPEDVYVNTFYFECPGTRIDIPDETISGLLTNFYNISPGGVGHAAIKTYLSPQLNGEFNVKLYDMADALPRIPVFESGVMSMSTMGSGTGVGLPSEVAACLSFRATPVPGVSPASTRGRIYLGPLDTEVNSGSSTTTSVIESGFCGSATQAGRELALAAIINDFEWVIWSPTTATAYPIEHIWMDNSFDTQRRRGHAATARVSADVH